MGNKFIVLDEENKMSESDSHVYFVSGPYSQWYPKTMKGRLTPDGPEMTFVSCEQYMMASKAVLFGDNATLIKIMEEKSPKLIKGLGRDVTPFDEDRWNEEAKPIVRRGNFYKFSQNDDLYAIMMAHRDKYLVEGAHYDRIWGVGLSWKDPRILDPANWDGTNWLGDSLMDVRSMLIELDAISGQSPYTVVDPFAWKLV